jgi:hypothetical protein
MTSGSTLIIYPIKIDAATIWTPGGRSLTGKWYRTALQQRLADRHNPLAVGGLRA